MSVERENDDKKSSISVVNFRDIGGLPALEGSVIRQGFLYRSAAPDYGNDQVVSALARRGVRFICDFRSAGERPCDPKVLAATAGIEYLAPNSEKPVGDPVTALRRCTISTAETQTLMHEVYRQIPFDQAPSFTVLFQRIVNNSMPILVHCASGKDRTGVFVALLLYILGVSRDLIGQEYAISNQWVEDITRAFHEDSRHAPLVAAPFEIWSPLMGSEPAYLDSMFDALKQAHGSVEAYLKEMLDVGEDERRFLRQLLLSTQR